MNLKKALINSLVAGNALLAINAPAEDIDLFTGVSSLNTGAPNILILLDNTANWNTPFTAEKTALTSVFGSLADPEWNGKFNLGLMLFTETGNPNDDIDGGFVRYGVRNMNSASGNIAALNNIVTNLDILADKSNGGKLGKAMNEVYLYFKGGTAYSGLGKAKRDYGGNTTYNPVCASLPGNALTDASDTTYNSPIDNPCGKNFIIYISNGAAQDNNADTTTATTFLSNAGGDTSTISLNPSGSQTNVGDEWARFLASADLSTTQPDAQNVTTYTIDVLPKTTGQGPGWTALLKSMAGVGNGRYFVADNAATVGTDIAKYLTDIFSEIQAVNSVFASASLPVTVNTQGTYLNQIYIGMFRPAESALPRWQGNLKQYKFIASLVNSEVVLEIGDKNGDPAISSSTGFITPCAVSHWTPSTQDTYWTFDSSGTCITSGAVNSNSPDGEIVEKGAAAYRLRDAISHTTTGNWSSRPIKTCTSGSCSGMPTNFNNTTVTAAALGIGNDTDGSPNANTRRDDIINFIRGKDYVDTTDSLILYSTDNDGNNNTSSLDTRPTVHGDVVHSRPLAIDFGTTSTPDVKVFYGGNDGMLHAINADQADSDGTELWSFVAPEHYGKLKRHYYNYPALDLPNLSVPGATKKDYFFDGPIGSYRVAIDANGDGDYVDVGDTNLAWIYPTMRRGGRMVYAFDVSTPASPTIKWAHGCPNAGDDTGCTSGWSTIGHTWSTPRSTKVTGYGSGASPILIMGGGYDSCEDSEPNTCSSPKGAGILVIDADTGTLLTTLATTRSVVADVTLVDTNFDGITDLAYAVDNGGNIYRINIGTAVPASWTITKIAALGCASPGTACSLNRKFQYAPDVVLGPYFYSVIVGSGDREHPLELNQAATVDNAFFVIKDKPADATWLNHDVDTASSAYCDGQNLICMGSLLAIDPDGATPSQADLDAKKGWYLSFGTGTHNMEQTVTSAVTVGGTIFFSTHTPTVPTTCGQDLGTARAYAVNYLDASPIGGGGRYDSFVGGGLPPSPVAGFVQVDDPDGSGGTITVPFVIGGKSLTGGTVSPLQGQKAPITTFGTATRTYWYIEQ
jgi:type IV pilus assembly protein PilY1